MTCTETTLALPNAAAGGNWVYALPSDANGNSINAHIVKRLEVDAYTLPYQLINANGNSGLINVSDYSVLEIQFYVDTFVGTSPTIALVFQSQALDPALGWFTIYAPAAYTSANSYAIPWTIGAPATPNGIPAAVAKGIRITWTIGGTGSPSVKMSLSVIGKS